MFLSGLQLAENRNCWFLSDSVYLLSSFCIDYTMREKSFALGLDFLFSTWKSHSDRNRVIKSGSITLTIFISSRVKLVLMSMRFGGFEVRYNSFGSF